MNPFVAFLLLLTTCSAGAQMTGWTVAHNQKVVLTASVESEQKNVVTLTKGALKKKGSLCICIAERGAPKDWQRIIGVFDEGDKELLQQKSDTLSLSNIQVSRLFQKTGKVKVATWLLPLDPKLAAAVRVRRVHLCTLVIK